MAIESRVVHNGLSNWYSPSFRDENNMGIVGIRALLKGQFHKQAPLRSKSWKGPTCNRITFHLYWKDGNPCRLPIWSFISGFVHDAKLAQTSNCVVSRRVETNLTKCNIFSIHVSWLVVLWYPSILWNNTYFSLLQWKARTHRVSCDF